MQKESSGMTIITLAEGAAGLRCIIDNFVSDEFLLDAGGFDRTMLCVIPSFLSVGALSLPCLVSAPENNNSDGSINLR